MKKSAQIQLFSRVTFLDKLLFTKHLSTMIKAGVPIADALSTLIEQTKSKAFKDTLKSVLSGIENGQSLASALKKQGRVFDQLYISLIEVSEESGTLEENLEFMSTQLGKQYSLRKKIQNAMLYPILIIVATFVMGGFISVFVLPKLLDFFEAFEVTLPLTTRILLFFANIMKSYGILIFGGIIALFVGVSLLIKTKAVRPLWHRFLLKIPVFGKMLAYGQLASFTRNFGVLLKSGVSVTKSIKVAAETLSNLKYRNDLIEIGRLLDKGKNISDAMANKKYNEFPPVVVKMIGVGETTGKLDETLLYLGDFYEEEIENISKNLTTILEPFLLITIGLVVGFVALAIITPIYELTGSIRR